MQDERVPGYVIRRNFTDDRGQKWAYVAQPTTAGSTGYFTSRAALEDWITDVAVKRAMEDEVGDVRA